jgi:hypothetical protein
MQLEEEEPSHQIVWLVPLRKVVMVLREVEGTQFLYWPAV